MKQLQLAGIGLRSLHHEEVLVTQPPVAWLEVHTENYFCEGGKPLHYLERIRAHYPISFHGVNLSIGSTDELNWQHLKRLKELMIKIDPCLVSDHLAWTSLDGQYFHDLLPLPFTEEVIKHVSTRIKQIQDYLGRQILIENISQYIQFPHSTLSEVECLVAIAQESACGILLDVNNVYVNATNFKFCAETYLDQIPPSLIQELHLAGFTQLELDQQILLIDAHNQPIVPAVWDLYRYAIDKFGVKPTMIEWDNDIPPLKNLCLEAYRAEKIMRESYGFTNQST